MPYFYLQLSAAIPPLSEECARDMFLAIQDDISTRLDCPMVHVTYSREVYIIQDSPEYDVILTMSAPLKLWNKFWQSRSLVRTSLKRLLTAKFAGVCHASRILVVTNTLYPVDRVYR